MNRAQFSDLIRAFVMRARPGRNLYIWHGQEQDLLDLLPSSNVHRLSIVEALASMADIPFVDDDSRYRLGRLVRQTLDELIAEDHGDPQILVVTGTILLARYGGANAFFDFVNDRRMVILQVNPGTVDAETLAHLPEYVQFRPAVELETLKHILERQENLITEEQQ